MANISKLNVLGTMYDLKDAAARQDLATLLNNKAAQALGTAAFVDSTSTLSKDDTTGAVATGAAVATAIEAAITGLGSVLHFRGVIEKNAEETDAAAIARSVSNPAAGDVVIIKGNHKEYIYDGTAWQEMGDEDIYLTKATAEADYVKKTTKVAGIDLADDITVTEMETALDIKALGHKASAEGSVTTVDSADDITVAKADTYTVAGTAVSVPQTYSALDVTPAGSVTVSADTAAAVSYEKAKSAATVSTAAVGEGQTANYTPAGTITLPTYTSTVTPTKEAVATVTDAGTGYSITDGSVTKGTDSTSKFATAGVTMAMSQVEGESEVLVITAATTSDAVTSSAAPVYVAPVLSGALPTFSTKDVVVSATVATAKDGDATFAGTGTIIGATLGYDTVSATVTQPTFTAEFSGTEKSVTPAVATSANAAPSNATITVGTETKSITLNKTSKTVTVQ